MFSLVIMDDAGQCNIAHALIPISRGESLLLVGDPQQLRPIIQLEESTNELLKQKFNIKDSYDYKKNSILDSMLLNDNISKYILLKYHYRCGKNIINFSNQRYYDNELIISQFAKDGELKYISVKNENPIRRNQAYEEAKQIVDYVKRNKLNSVSIITPFVNQRNLIQGMLQENKIENVNCGTIHSLQGAEADTVIFSPALSFKTSQKTFEWLKNNSELINVGVTRAKKGLIIVGDDAALKKLSKGEDNDLASLVRYTQQKGTIVIPPSKINKIEIGMSNGSVFEDHFYTTIAHFCSCNAVYEAKRNVKLSKLLYKNEEPLNKDYEFDLVLFKKGIFNIKPVIAFEVNGGEHFGKLEREKSDNFKMTFCKAHNIELIIIPNSYVKHYEYISDIILLCQKHSTSKQISLFE